MKQKKSLNKTKKQKNISKKRSISSEDISDLIKEEHILDIIKKLEKNRDTKDITDKVKKEKKDDEEDKKPKKDKISSKVKDAYSLGKNTGNTSYSGLEDSGLYSQINISYFTGFIYKSNIKGNDEFYQHLAAGKDYSNGDQTGEHNLASSRMMDQVGWKFTLNFLIGTDMNDVSVEEKERVKNNLYDPAQKIIYFAKIEHMGFGNQNPTTGGIITNLKTTYVPGK